MNLYTVHHHLGLHRYGFETSQQARMNLARLNGLGYTHLVTGVQFCEDIKRSFKGLGYTYGSLVYLPELFLGEQLSNIESTKVEFSKGSYAQFFYYSDDAKPLNCSTDSWMYFKDGEWYSEEDLVVWYFSNLDDLTNSVVIRDDFRLPMPKLRRFMSFRGVSYYECIHMDIMGSNFLSLLNNKTTYLVASELLVGYLRNLGYSALFLPPIYIDNSIKTKVISSVKRYLYVGNMSHYKNPEQLIDIANILLGSTFPNDITIDIYGGTSEIFDKLLDGGIPPSNINYKGSVSSVPYGLYDGYISTSSRELFSNTCVEAMSNGLKCICSDILLPYRYYHDNTGGEVSICRTTGDFIDEVIKSYETGFTSSNQANFLVRYTQDEVSALFLKIINKGLCYEK